MRISARYFIALSIILSLFAVVPVQALDEEFRFFDQTGHNVQGMFWDYYQSVKDAETVLGYPITEEFVNRENKLVQYFQRARLEVSDGQVRLSALGLDSYRSGIQLNINNSLACRAYDTGFSICFSFLEYFDAHGGLALFGYPISPFEYQDKVIVQYFQNGRLEWHPSNPDGQRVVTGDLGLPYFNKVNEDPARLQPAMPLNRSILPQVTSLNTRAFPWKAVTYSTDQQVIFVVVQDQTLQPIEGATGEVIVKWTTGMESRFPLLTDAKGIATVAVPVENQLYGGLVTVDVVVSHGELAGQTTTSFRIWY